VKDEEVDSLKVASLLLSSTSMPKDKSDYMRIDLDGKSFYINLTMARSEEYWDAFTYLLNNNSSYEAYRAVNSQWQKVSKEELNNKMVQFFSNYRILKDLKKDINRDKYFKINFNMPIIGRNEEIKAIISAINSIEKYHESNNIILIHGEIGIGKSRLIEHIKYRINMKENKDSNCIHIKGNKDDSTKLIINQLLRQIVSVADKSLVNKYKKELINFVPDMYGEEKQVGCEVDALNSKSRFILIAKISSFLQEYYSQNPGIIIADDMNIYDDFTLSIIQYILSKTIIGSNITAILSYRDGDCLNNSKFTEIIAQITGKVNLNIHLRPLLEDKAGQVLKNVLNFLQ